MDKLESSIQGKANIAFGGKIDYKYYKEGE